MVDNPFPNIDLKKLFSPKDPWVLSTIASTRGGSGKTTLTVLAGLYNLFRHVPTILIDIDRDAALTTMMLPSERLSSRISENDKSIRPSLMDVINEYQASGDVIGKFKEALITSDASPEDNNLLILPSDHRLKKVDFDEDLREAFLATIDFLIKNGPSVFGPRVVFIDPSNHPFPIELALRAIMNRPNGGAFITFPTQRVAVRATLGTAKMVRDFHIRTLGFIPVKYGASQQYIDVINSMRTRGFPVLTGIPMSARFAAPNHLWAISNKFPMEYAYSINEITRSLLPGFPPEPPTHLSRAALATMPSEG